MPIQCRGPYIYDFYRHYWHIVFIEPHSIFRKKNLEKPLYSNNVLGDTALYRGPTDGGVISLLLLYLH